MKLFIQSLFFKWVFGKSFVNNFVNMWQQNKYLIHIIRGIFQVIEPAERKTLYKFFQFPDCILTYNVCNIKIFVMVIVYLKKNCFDFCRFCVVIRFFHPRHNGQWPPTSTSKDFYTRSYPLHYFSYLNSWERASIFPFQCWVLNKGTTGTIFITSLVWRGPWLVIEPGTSRTRS